MAWAGGISHIPLRQRVMGYDDHDLPIARIRPASCSIPASTSPSRARTYNLAVNSRSLYQLSYRGIFTCSTGGRPRRSPLDHAMPEPPEFKDRRRGVKMHTRLHLSEPVARTRFPAARAPPLPPSFRPILAGSHANTPRTTRRTPATRPSEPTEHLSTRPEHGNAQRKPMPEIAGSQPGSHLGNTTPGITAPAAPPSRWQRHPGFVKQAPRPHMISAPPLHGGSDASHVHPRATPLREPDAGRIHHPTTRHRGADAGHVHPRRQPGIASRPNGPKLRVLYLICTGPCWSKTDNSRSAPTKSNDSSRCC